MVIGKIHIVIMLGLRRCVVRPVPGVPAGYKLKTGGLVGRSEDFRFGGDQVVVVEVTCLSLPVVVSVEKIDRTSVRDWWSYFIGPATFHMEDQITEKWKQHIVPFGVIFLETSIFGRGPFSYHFRVSTEAAIAAGGQPPGAGSAPGLLSARFWSVV